ncbi:IS1634 family transposase [Streptomyces sp. SID10815]|uniref:IS1634 family transposase n=1 Tax=Streptomyces sp. SID10815 TaxID=2706027 RepID=UPI0013C71B46|nr:IS1634 family transposase [Streptomyces sp. SID10815]NEA49383.1 IS1634 family transposase [Streptomyces sp. SID10815]
MGDPELLNDDRLGRALDAIAPHLDEITGSIAAQAICEFGIDTATLHWDMTSMSLTGAFAPDDQDPDYPVVAYGHPKDRRVDLKQIQAGLGISADGAIPLLATAISGQTGEITQVVSAIARFQKTADVKRFLMTGDSKLVSYDNLTALSGAQVEFIAPLAASATDPAVFAALDPATAERVEHVPLRVADRPTMDHPDYRVLEDTHTLTGKRKSDPPITVRRVLVHSPGNALAQAKARDKRLAKAREDLDKLTRLAGGRYYPTRDKISAKIGVISAKRRVADCLRTHIADGSNGKPALTWHFDQDVLDTQAKADGWYALITNQDPAKADAADVFLAHKGQPRVERRYSELKGPLAVAPVFLHGNKRIAALLHVLMLALLVYSLIERQVRRALERDGSPDGRMTGLYPDNRRERPTARMIFYHLGELDLATGPASDPPQLLHITRGVQLHLLDLLEISST